MICSYVCLLSLIDKKIIIKWKYFLIIFLIIFIGIKIYYNNHIYSYLIFILIHLLIFIRVANIFLQNIVKTRTLNIFFIVLLFFEFSLVNRFFVWMSYPSANIYYSIIMLFIEDVVGIFFCLFTVDNPRLLIKIRNADSNNNSESK